MRKLYLLLFYAVMASSYALAQNRTITGTVENEKGDPLSGATIYVVGGGSSVTTDVSGNFKVTISPNARQLAITYVGYTSQTITIRNQATLSVKLVSNDPSLSEVVVVAYGSVKKEALTGSVGTIKAESIKQRPINNITNAVEGAIPGVVVSSANGQPGSGNTIRVRGFGSVTGASNSPLFVVDGVTYLGGTSNLNPDDVESITVLKDAASTALYGSRAANGVVIITTKKGLKGRNNVSVRLMQGVATRGLAEYDRVDAFQYYPLMWESYRNSLVYPATGSAISIDSANKVATGLTTRSSIKDLLAYNPFNVSPTTIVGTDGRLNSAAQLIYPDDLDWTKELMRNGSRKDYSVNFNGGAEKSDYFLSVGYLKEDGYTLKTDFERFSARLNVNAQPKTWFKTGLNISGNYSSSNLAADDGSTNFVNPFYFARNIAPIYPVFAHNMTTGDYVLDANGNKIWDLGNFGTSALGIANGIANRAGSGFAGRHSIGETSLNESMFRRTVVSARNYADITFLKNFKFTNNVAVDMQNQNNASSENTLVGDGAPAGRSRRIAATVTGLTLNQLLTYGKAFGNHRVDVLVGHETFNRRETELNTFKQGQSLSGNTELRNYTNINSATSLVDKNTIESYFSRVNYSFTNQFYVSGSVRRDANSRFAEQSRWGTFWSVGGGWNINQALFMKSIDWIDQLKLRSSYGVVGNAELTGSFYNYQGLYAFNNNANEPGIVQSQTAFLNGELTWEENKQFDIGVDFSLFKGRLSGAIEYYHRETGGLLFEVPQPLSSGALTVQQNTATMYNKGIELQLSGNIIQTKSFIWNTNINLSTVKNQITSMPPTAKEIVSGTKKLAEGHSQYDYWLRTYYGVDPTDGAALYVSANTATTTNRRFITNKNGLVDTVTTLLSNGKFEYHDSAIPDLYGSVSQSFTYKNFTLSALFTFQLGGTTFDALYQGLMASGSYGNALHPDMLNSWRKAGDITNVPRLDAGRNVDFNGTSSRWLVDASYLNIRTLNLSYSVPKSLLTRVSVNNAQVFVTVENPVFFSKRKGLNNQQAFTGVTSNAYPPARVFSGGVSLNF